jgi:hypothetical protein
MCPALSQNPVAFPQKEVFRLKESSGRLAKGKFPSRETPLSPRKRKSPTGRRKFPFGKRKSLSGNWQSLFEKKKLPCGETELSSAKRKSHC